jgi:beta-phosphoglucomutase-like phosphatase (HAD superfamily)
MVDAPAAVLFDMDGLLVDTERLWTIAQEELAARHGGVLTPAIKAALHGRGGADALRLLLTEIGAPASAFDEALSCLAARIVELFGEPGAILARPGALELVRALAAAGIPMALVSSSIRVLVDRVLDSVGRDHFRVSVAGDEVGRTKPDPEPYLTAARLLGVPPTSCAVLEDSASGAEAGLAAGCVTVLVPSTDVIPTVPAATVVESLRHVSVAHLRDLFVPKPRGTG